MWGTISEYLSKATILKRLLDSGYRYSIHPLETAAGLTGTQLTFGFDPGHLSRYGAVGDGVTDDTAAFNTWLSVVKQGITGHIPMPQAGKSFLIPNGLTISGHTLTKFTCDPAALVKVTSASVYALTLTNNILVDFEIPNLSCAGGGIRMTSTNAQTVRNRIRAHEITGPGKLAAKPSAPMVGFAGAIATLGAITGGTLYTNGTYKGVALTGGHGTGATANITISGGAVTQVLLVDSGTSYQVNDSLSAAAASIGGTGSGFAVPVATISTGATIGLYIEGPQIGNANYYHVIDQPYIQNFDTCIAIHTPAAIGSANANANIVNNPHMEGFWFGVYTNSVENQVLGAQWNGTDGTSAGALAECIRIGDAALVPNFNIITGVSESGGSFVRSVNILTAATGNWIQIADNEPYGAADAGSDNTILAHPSTQWGKLANFLLGMSVQAASGAADAIAVTAPGAVGYYGVNIDGSAANATAFKVKGRAAGTAMIVLNNTATTGAQTPTLGTNKPGVANGTPGVWIPVVLDGTTYYIPAWN